jgi:hypothetical protein|nr:MAG: hypothetical protein [Lake Baikal virophage 6]
MATIINEQAFYVCGCGYEKSVMGGEKSRTGLELVRRLHSKVCEIASKSTMKGKQMFECPTINKPFADKQMREGVNKILCEAREKLTETGAKTKL